MPVLTGKDLEKHLPVTVALVGSPFTGKTESIKTLHNYYKRKGLPSAIHILDYDQKADTLVRAAREGKWLDDLFVHRLNVPEERTMSELEIPNRSRAIYEAAIRELNSFNDLLNPDGTWKNSGIGAIVHDSYTELIRILWDGILAMRGKEVGGSVAGADHRPQKGGESEDIEFTEWRLLREKVEEYIRVAKSFPCDRVFCFHEEITHEEIKPLKGGGQSTVLTTPSGLGGTNRRIRLPIGGTRRLSSMIGKFFTIMLYTEIDSSKRDSERFRWITQPNSEIPAAGTCLRSLLPEDVQQDFANVLS